MKARITGMANVVLLPDHDIYEACVKVNVAVEDSGCQQELLTIEFHDKENAEWYAQQINCGKFTKISEGVTRNGECLKAVKIYDIYWR